MTKDNWTPWCRDFHYGQGIPSVTIGTGGITLNASINKIVNVSKYVNIEIDLNHSNKELASKVRCTHNIERGK